MDTPPTPGAASNVSSASSADVKTIVGYIPDDDMREGAGDLGLKRRPWRRSPMDWRTIVAHEYKGAGTPEDPYVVVWLPHDTENPYRWTPLYKWTLTILGEYNGKIWVSHGTACNACHTAPGTDRHCHSRFHFSSLMSAAAGTLAVTMGSSVLSAAMGSIRHDFPNHNDQMYIMGECHCAGPRGPRV